ncbi:MAG: protein kinase [Bryobacteraceae bacterium]
MAFSIGDSVGPYTLLAPLGEGGMGEVWKAQDTRLDRTVAIKFSKEQFNERFDREARAVAALNHPNVCQVYDVGPDYLVLEYVDGLTLSERMAAGPIERGELVSLARQIAEGLEAAHEKGIVHRDLKPANVKITSDGLVKVLDFGLATVRQPAGRTSSADPANSPTLVAATIPGMIMGTASYMSPEQASGKPVDKRSDIWAFGVVLWEMLTGRRLFEGETVSHTLADVLKGEIPLSALPPQTPRQLKELVRRCLERDVKLRLRDIGEARVVLSQPLAETPAHAPVAQQPSKAGWIAAAAACAGLCFTLWAWWNASRTSQQPPSRFDVEMGPDFNLAGIDAPHLILSPDGRRIVWQVRQGAKVMLAIRELGETRPTILPATEAATHQFFSPDGEWIGFHDRAFLKKVSIHGGSPVVICPLRSLRGASWGDDGNIVFSPDQASPLMQVSANGGTPRQVTTLNDKNGERTHRYPFVLPGSKAALFFTGPGANYDSSTIEAVRLDTGERKVLVHGGYFPRFVAGYLLFMRQGSIHAVRMDPGKLQVQGSPVPVLPGVRHHLGRGSAEFDLSASGALVYVEGAGTLTTFPLALYGSNGTKAVYLQKPQEYTAMRFSPDGKRLAFETLESGKRDIWIHDSEREVTTRLTHVPGDNTNPVWTPSGDRIAFRQRDGIFWMSSAGGGAPERLTESPNGQTPLAFSPDGKVLAFTEDKAGGDIRLMDMDSRKARDWIATPFEEREGGFSPDGNWFAYVSNESGRDEVYVQSYPAGNSRVQISNGGGRIPRWSRNGKDLGTLPPGGK